VIQTDHIAVSKYTHKLASELSRRTDDEWTHETRGTLYEIALPFEAGRDDDGASKNAAHYRMIRANNPEIDFESLNARVQAAASRLRDLNVVEEQRRARRDDDDSTPQMALTRYRAVNAYLDRAEDFNQPKSRAPRRLAKYERMAPKAMHFALKFFNRVFRQQREVNEAQIDALRQLTLASLASTRRVMQLEREIERLRRQIEP
jgi:hypothetical protein